MQPFFWNVHAWVRKQTDPYGKPQYIQYNFAPPLQVLRDVAPTEADLLQWLEQTAPIPQATSAEYATIAQHEAVITD